MRYGTYCFDLQLLVVSKEMEETDNSMSDLGTGASYINLRDNNEEIETFCSTVVTEGENTTDQFGTGIVGSQAASSAAPLDTETPYRPETQTLLDPDSVLSIPKPDMPEVFSIATAETVPTAAGERSLGAVELRPPSMEIASMTENETEYHWRHIRETASKQAHMILISVPYPANKQQAEEFMKLRLELENKIKVTEEADVSMAIAETKYALQLRKYQWMTAATATMAPV